MAPRAVASRHTRPPKNAGANCAMAANDTSPMDTRPCDSPAPSRAWRTTFSTTTIASSTRMPIEKIKAKSVMRFSV